VPAVKLTYNNTDYENEIVAEGGRIEMTHAMAGESLSADSLTVPITTGGQPIRLLAADQEDNDLLVSDDNEILCLDSGVNAPEYIKNSPGLLYYGNDLLVKHYLHQINRRSKYEYEMVFYSAVWLLDQSDHVGGLYTGETAETVLSDILSNIVMYSIDDDIKGIQIYGYLPYDKRRNNLMKVLMAIGAALKNASDGSLRITQLSDAVAGVFGEERVYLGGKVSHTSPATAVQVTEHNYLPSEEEVILFDDSTVGTETVIFNEPYHDLTIDNGTIISSGVNYCTFSATGYVKLTGKRYNHVTRIVTVGDVPTGTDTDTVRRVTDNTLLTPVNAQAVAEKLYEYLTKSEIIRQDVLVGTERPGDVVSVLNPYTKEMVEACIKSMSVQFGKSNLKATCEFLVGYIPAGITTGFENYVVLTGSGTWTPPAGTTKIRAILVNPGNDGKDGERGGDTTAWSTSLPVNVGKGGKGGDGGDGGEILEINLNVTPEAPISYACGQNEGEETTFGGYSAKLGRKYPYGYYEPKSGLTLGKKGENGVDGRPGNSFQEVGEPIVYKDVTYNCGSNGANYTRGGSYPGTAFGGGGGGAAVGGNGQNGKNGSEGLFYEPGVGSRDYLFHGDGGNGASATIPGEDAAEYGQGGGGGHGGGGAGYEIGKLPTNNYNSPTPPFSSPAFDLPKGGSGSPGGKGGPGCIIVYY